MKNIVTVGGGTGSYTILFGLKNLEDVSLTALVSMADNGGSTGILRDELGVLPAGDVRQCLVALSDHTDIVRKLMSYRFSEGTLSGHSFGNILLAALEKVTGDFVTGVEVASEILKVKGTVVPVTSNKAELYALLKSKFLVKGIVSINQTNLQGINLKKIFYKKNVKLNKNAKNAILKADYILIGPGNYYCSVIPNIVVNGFKEAIHKSKAQIILPVNLTNKQEHTKNWKVSDYVKNTEMYLGKPVDIILVNTEPPSKKQIEHYKLKEGGGILVKDDFNDIRVVRKPLMSHSFFKYNKADARQHIRSFIRHDSVKLANCIAHIIKKNKIKLILDFDDVIFNNTKQFKKHMYLCLEKNGITHSVAENYYKKVRENEFSLKNFISYLIVSEGLRKNQQKKIHEEIMHKCKNFLNMELLEVIRKMGKSNCYLITNGDKEFQKDKIKNSGVSKLFFDIKIVPRSKKEVIEKICKENKDYDIIFLEDKEKFLNDINFRKCQNLTTVLYNEQNHKDILKRINTS